MLEGPQSLLLLAAMVGLGAPARASAGRWTVESGKSRITVHVFKKGLFSGLAHDHHFAVRRWSGTATFDPASPSGTRVELVLAADSLADEQPSLSQKDREKVNRQAAGPDVLDAQHHPEIRFAASALEVAPAAAARLPDALQGRLTGTLSVRGQSRPLSVPVAAVKEGDGWRARGEVAFKQSDFGIRPYSGFAGTIAVHDEVKLEYDLLVVPAP